MTFSSAGPLLQGIESYNELPIMISAFYHIIEGDDAPTFKGALNRDSTKKLEQFATVILNTVERFNNTASPSIKSISANDLANFASSYTKLIKVEIPSAIKGANHFVMTSATSGSYSYCNVYLYLSVAKKLFDEIDHEQQDEMLSLGKRLEKKLSKNSFTHFEGEKKILLEKLKEVFLDSVIRSKQRERYQKLLSSQENIIARLNINNRFEINPYGRYSRAVYCSLNTALYTDDRMLRQELRENLYLSPRDLTLCKKTITLVDDEMEVAIERIYTLVTGTIPENLAIEKCCLFLTLAIERYNSLPLPLQKKVKEIADTITSTPPENLIRDHTKNSEAHIGLLLYLAERISVIDSIPISLCFHSFEKQILEESVLAKEEQDLDKGWENIKNTSPLRCESTNNSDANDSDDLSLDNFLAEASFLSRS